MVSKGALVDFMGLLIIKVFFFVVCILWLLGVIVS